MKIKIVFSIIAAFLIFMQFQVNAQINPVQITENYYQGVVKILLFDPVLAQIDDETLGYMGRGSGFIVTEDGVIFTNRHVIEQCVYGYLLYQDNYGDYQIETYSQGMEKNYDLDCIIFDGYTVPIVQVYYGQGPEDYDLYLAEVLTLSDAYDGAVLKIVSDIDGNPPTKKFTTLPLGNSDKVKMGEDLVVLGYPAQYQGNFDLALKDMMTFTKGYHSGLDYVFNEDYGFIKTDASINGGNSGGPVFGKDNTVIGIASAKGLSTNIGLVGGINGMYYVCAPESRIFTNLIAKGLSAPAKADNIAVTKGTPKSMPSFAYCEDESSSSSTTEVTGVIKSADTGRPIKDAVVGLLIYDESIDDFVVVSGGVSNAKGEFVMEPEVDLDVDYGVACMATGYEDLVEIITITESTNYLTITLAKAR
jgi:serine protease Do